MFEHYWRTDIVKTNISGPDELDVQVYNPKSYLNLSQSSCKVIQQERSYQS